MTVHDFLESFTVNEIREIPTNCVGTSLADYGRSRFGFKFVIKGEAIQRVEPKCSVCGFRCRACVPGYPKIGLSRGR